MEPPSELLMELLPFQKEFLGWAVGQEKGAIKGGILADEMGMGKTIQVSLGAAALHAPKPRFYFARLHLESGMKKSCEYGSRICVEKRILDLGRIELQ